MFTTPEIFLKSNTTFCHFLKFCINYFFLIEMVLFYQMPSIVFAEVRYSYLNFLSCCFVFKMGQFTFLQSMPVFACNEDTHTRGQTTEALHERTSKQWNGSFFVLNTPSNSRNRHENTVPHVASSAPGQAAEITTNVFQQMCTAVHQSKELSKFIDLPFIDADINIGTVLCFVRAVRRVTVVVICCTSEVHMTRRTGH